MCLGVPGQVVRIGEPLNGVPMGTVSFGGILKEVCLGYVPDVRVGEYVVVHVGFAISRIDATEAERVFLELRALGETAELDLPEVEASIRAGAEPGAPAPRTPEA
jgi:hydrogenase expression/formation protein HypC